MTGKTPDWQPVRPFHDFEAAQVAPFDTRQSIFVPDGSITDGKVAPGISSRKLTGFGAKVYNSANQAITTATNTAITFDSVSYDQGNFFDSTNNTRLTFPFDGVYDITAFAEFATSPTGTYRRCAIIKNNNGSNEIQENRFPLTGVVTHTSCNLVQFFARGDYIELVVNHDRGINLNVNGGVANNFLSAVFLFVI